MSTQKMTNEEVKQLRLRVATLEEQLAERDQTVLEQSAKPEQEIAEHKRVEEELQQYREELENLVEARTIELEQSQQLLKTILETVAEVTAVASTILDVDQLLQEVVDLTKDRFGLYHAHIYLINDVEATLNLAAGAGDVGRQMVGEGWQIPLDREQSLVAQAARTKQGVIVNNVRKAPDFFQNPLLPHTQSEMAVPMLVGDQLLGVLDVQADKAGCFKEEDIQIQTILATQIAVAIRNAHLYRQTETHARREQLLRKITTRVRGSVDVDTVMRTAAQEIGQALGRPTYVHLGSNGSKSEL